MSETISENKHKLYLTFEDGQGQKTTMSFDYVKPDVEISRLQNLANGIIQNGEIFTSKPVKIFGARIVEVKKSEVEKEEWGM